jgi:MFS family permease
LADPADNPSPVVEAMYAREMWPWALLGIGCGLVEGGTVAVLVKRGFTGLVTPQAVDFAVAVVSGAPALANISSFAWANLAHGRARVGVLASIQAAFAIAVGLVALAPIAPGGLALTLFAVIVARVLWAGILTVRAAIWSANYPRHVMARITSRIVMASSLGIALVALLAGWILDAHARSARWLYLFASLCGLVAALRYRAVRVRREYQLLAAEAQVGAGDSAFSLSMFRQILREDAPFRSYMFWMSLYGSGNLMMTAQLVVLFSDRLHLSSLMQILLLTVVPLLLMPLFLPAWARLFDRGHIIEYRSRQCWALVAAIVCMTAGVMLRVQALLWLGALLIGISYAGANLGWNLGHNDFASPGRAQHYMGVHVTLTGVRGLIAPALGMACYELVEWRWPGWGAVVLLLPLALVTAGALGFVSMRYTMRETFVRT